MAKGFQKNKDRKEAIGSFGKSIGKRSRFKCEWCESKEELRVWDCLPDLPPNKKGTARLSMIFFITGLFSIFTGPILGKLSDKFGKYRLFIFGSLLSMLMVFVYTNLGPNPLWVIVLINVVLWIGISSRMISSSALTPGVPEMKDRGAYMGINSSMQQFFRWRCRICFRTYCLSTD